LRMLKWKVSSVDVEILLILIQDQCTVCTTMGSAIVLDAPDGTSR
jgi:hypothetical protein